MEPQLRQQMTQIHNLLHESNADELLVNGSRGTFLVDKIGATPIQPLFSTANEIADLARELAWCYGRRLDPYHPATGGSLDEWGLRWHAVINPVAQDEIIFSVRRHRFEQLNLDAFMPSDDTIRHLQDAVAQKRAILIAGATGVGKTTFLVSLLKAYFFEQRVVILEALSEIPPLSPKWLRMTEAPAQISGKGAVSLLEVGRECLRLRPDTLVVGEIRAQEASVFLDMSQTGHGGCLATIHGGTIEQAKRRLINLAGDAAKAVTKDFEILVVLLEKENGGICVRHLEVVNLL